MRLLDSQFLVRTAAATVIVAALPCSVLAQDASNSINITGAAAPGGGDLKSATVLMLEYERLVAQKLSVFGRVSSLKYKYDDGNYLEDGDGTGVGLGVRFYPSRGLKGFYIGGGIGRFETTWTWTDDKGKLSESRGKGDSSSFQWGGELGYRFNLGGGNVSLTPALNIGSWAGGDNNCTYTYPPALAGRSCTKSSQLGFYAVASVSLGIAF